MEFTGEQVVLGTSKQRLVDEDIARYRFVSSFVKGKKILDIASGTGIGCMLFSSVAQEVVGVDISNESISYALTHNAAPNVRYILGSADDSSLFPAASFDVISSLETIEHLEDSARKTYLANLASWLRPEGVLILSTPNKRITSPFSQKPENKYHVLEFTREKLEEEIVEHFTVEQWLGQRSIPKTLAWPIVRRLVNILQVICRRNFHIYTLSGSAEVLSYDDRRIEPRIFVVVLKKHKN